MMKHMMERNMFMIVSLGKPVTMHATEDVELLNKSPEDSIGVLWSQSKPAEVCLLGSLNGALVNHLIHLRVMTRESIGIHLPESDNCSRRCVVIPDTSKMGSNISRTFHAVICSTHV